MGKSRRQDTRSEQSDRAEIQRLRETIRSQNKVISRLNKELNRRTDVSEELRELLGEQEAESPEPKSPPKCPTCKAEVEEIPIGKFTLLRCTSGACNWRKRITK